MVAEEIVNIREQLDEELKVLRERICAIEDVQPAAAINDIDLNIVIYQLPESNNENIANKVDGLQEEGMALRSVTVERAERKQSRNERYPANF